MGSRHIPVLVEEVISLLRCEPHQIYVDATLGGGGHALEILRRTAPDGIVIGIEWDEDALSEARDGSKDGVVGSGPRQPPFRGRSRRDDLLLWRRAMEQAHCESDRRGEKAGFH